MSYEKKKAFLLERAKKETHLTTTDRYLVDDYITEFSVKFIPKNFGAHGCPDLAKTLKKMHDEKIFSRWANGLDTGMSGMGYPKWTWMYCVYEKHHDYRRKP